MQMGALGWECADESMGMGAWRQELWDVIVRMGEWGWEQFLLTIYFTKKMIFFSSNDSNFHIGMEA